MSRRVLIILSLLIQLALAPFLAHGYDFMVSYVAGRNIVAGSSPYEGGATPPDLRGYGTEIQGLGETPLWALYLGLCYFLSQGNYYIFNLLTKFPIIGANLVLSYIASRNGRSSSYLVFLFNPFVILISSVWGKPDNLATLLAIVAVSLNASSGAALMALSLMIKPLAMPLLPPSMGFFLRRNGFRGMTIYVFILISVGAVTFFAPFLIMGWPLRTVVFGLPNWFSPAGGLSVFNVLDLLYGSSNLLDFLWWAGYFPLAVLIVSLLYSLLKPPQDKTALAKYSLVASAIFFTTRAWVSEQNLIILFPLFLMVAGRLPNLLWAIPLFFSLVNMSLLQNLFLVYPGVIPLIREFDSSWGPLRLLVKFLINFPWLYFLYLSVRNALHKE